MGREDLLYAKEISEFSDLKNGVEVEFPSIIKHSSCFYVEHRLMLILGEIAHTTVRYSELKCCPLLVIWRCHGGLRWRIL